MRVRERRGRERGDSLRVKERGEIGEVDAREEVKCEWNGVKCRNGPNEGAKWSVGEERNASSGRKMEKVETTICADIAGEEMEGGRKTMR
jgi:hypothetical protein